MTNVNLPEPIFRRDGAAVFKSVLPFLLRRYLFAAWHSRKNSNPAAVGVFLPMLGVAVGVFAFTTVLGIMGGFVNITKGRLLSLEPHIEVVKKGSFGQIPEDKKLLEEVRSLSPEILGATPFQKGDAILQARSRAATILLVGVDPLLAESGTQISKVMHSRKVIVLGREVAVADEAEESGAMGSFPPILVGKQLLQHLNLSTGERATLMSTIAEEGPFGMAPRQMPVAPVDYYDIGNAAYDLKWVFASLDTVNRFFESEGMWAGIQLRVREPLDVDSLVLELDKRLDRYQLRAKPWTEANRALLKALKIERWAMGFVLMMIILVACFSITITLVMAVRRKAREMAILRAVGLRKRELGLLYLFEGFLIGLFGVVIGLGLGLLVLAIVQRVPVPFLTSAYNGRLPVLINWNDLIFVSVGSVTLAMIGAVWPALEVMRIDVIETLADRG